MKPQLVQQVDDERGEVEGERKRGTLIRRSKGRKWHREMEGEED